MRSVYVSVINDLVTDQRVRRHVDFLVERGMEVTWIGRRLKNSPDTGETAFRVKRFRMLFTSGPLFYACYNLRLFFYLLFRRRPLLLVSNDLDTLPANYLVSKIRRVHLLYDSHEYFTGVPELIGRPRVQKLWKRIEGLLVPGLKLAMTVSPSIANLYREKYHVDFEVVRNLPRKRGPVKDASFRLLYEGKNIILYQGAVNLGRGLELLIETMIFLEQTVFLIAGDGDIVNDLRALIRERDLGDRVFLLGRLQPEELFRITCNADLGTSMEEDLGLNYRFALPNKIFDYIQARIPVLCSDLPEMKAVVEDYKIGIATPVREPEKLAEIIEGMLVGRKEGRWETALEGASRQLCWENESAVLDRMLSKLGI
ncbi:MAG: glycosyltransferase [Bacteroidales bacterium]|nr:glycosyltransferase [Bacteroidales bacterium]